MPAKRSKVRKIEVIPIGRAAARRSVGQKMSTSASKTEWESGRVSSGNVYSCAIEKNQNGKYNVRMRAVFGRDRWTLPVYFLASSFDAAMKKLEESLQFLQKSEERLRFWALERSDDPNLAGDLLKEFGLGLDRRKDLPRKVAEVEVGLERPVPASLLAPARRILADSMAQERSQRAAAAAGD
jgi:hypothetical protein